MEKLDIERLHNVHFSDFTERRQGITTYLFDSVLRTVELGDGKHIYFISHNSMRTAMDYLKMFMNFLNKQNTIFIKKHSNKLTIGKSIIEFTSFDYFKNNRLGDDRDYYLFEDF